MASQIITTAIEATRLGLGAETLQSDRCGMKTLKLTAFRDGKPVEVTVGHYERVEAKALEYVKDNVDFTITDLTGPAQGSGKTQLGGMHATGRSH